MTKTYTIKEIEDMAVNFMKEIDKFKDVSQDMYKKFAKASILVSLNHPLMQFTVSAIIVLISLVRSFRK